MIYTIAIVLLISSAIAAAGANEDTDGDRNVYVLLLGTSGCGKSSTINFLLNKAIAGVGDSDSTTSAIHEYTVQISAHAGGTGNLTFIDTPGYGDTRGLEYDARFIASLQEYFQTHEELSKRKPDIVLLCHRYDDNRFSGQASQFVKILKGLSLVQDAWFGHHRDNVCNTAILLTHSRTGADSEQRIPAYRKTLEDYTQFRSSMTILLGDNKIKSQNQIVKMSDGDSEEESEEHPIRSPGFGLWYPQNVCNWMKLAAPTSSAKIDAVCNLSYQSVEETNTVVLLGSNDSKTKSTLQTLTKIELLVEETPVSLALTSAFEKLKVLGQNETFHPQQDSLSYLQKSLNLLRIINLEDVPVTNVEVTRLFRSLRTSHAILALLKTAFGIEPIELFGVAKLPVGFNYEAAQKSVMSHSVFDLTSFQTSLIGYKIPIPVVCTRLASAEQNKKLRIDGTTIGLEYRFIHCKLRDAPEIQSSTNYLTKVASLGGFDQNDYESIFKWKSFLQKFGTHLVAESYLGGQIRISNIPETWNVGTMSISEDGLIKKLMNEATGEIRITISGGSESFHSTNPKIFFRRPLLYQSWLKSIEDFPVPLPDSFQIRPVQDYLRLVNASLANQLVKAVTYFESAAATTPPEQLIVSNLAACINDKNATLTQNYEIAHKLISSEASLKETQIKLVSTEAERIRLNSENENHKTLLASARTQTVTEQTHSRELNRLLGVCNTQATNAQASLATCNSEKQTCEAQRLYRHRGIGGNWNRHWHGRRH